MATLVLAAILALAAEWIARAPSTVATPGAPADLDTFLTALRQPAGKSGYSGRLASDPLGVRRTAAASGTVAPPGGVSTVSSSGRRGRLTAILIADDRSVAVIDEQAVSVGDRLLDGSRVEAIRTDRVSILDRNGQRRTLTLTPGRQ